MLTPAMFAKHEGTEPGKGGKVQITDALMKQAQDGCVMAYNFRGKRFDCGSIEGFVEATNHVFENVYLKEQAELEKAKQEKGNK